MKQKHLKLREKLKSSKLINFKKKINPVNILIISIITILIFYLLSSKISFLNSFQIILKANPSFILLSLLFLLLTLFFLMIRWLLIIRALHPKAKFKDSLISIMCALSLNSVLPSKLGDLFKVYYFKEHGISQMLGAVFTERILDIFSLTLLLLIGSLILNKLTFIYISIAVILMFILSVSFLYILRKKLRKYSLLKNLLYSINWIIHRPCKGLILFLLSLLVWFCSITQIYLLFLAVSANVDFLYFSSAIIIVIFVSLIPITLAGMGTRESAIIFLFSSFASNEILLAAGLLFSFFRYWLLSILGIPFLYLAIKKKKN